MPNVHEQARATAREVLTDIFGSCTEGEVKALCGVSWLETHYGESWEGAGKGSRNKGAIQCGRGWTGKRFSYVDTHPNPDGTSTTYRVDFRAYDSEAESWKDLAKVVYVNCHRYSVRNAAKSNDWYGVSQNLRLTGYYEGFGKTQEDRIQNHYRALTGAIALADRAERPTAPLHGVPETIRRERPARYRATVAVMQTALGIAADGLWGDVTDRALRAAQAANGLTVDGVCGPATWGAIL